MTARPPAVHDASRKRARRLPTPAQLAQVGTVLCLFRQQPGGELAGWAQAVRAEAGAEVDSDGTCESLSFFDRADRCCWRLYLLPDSDFLAWERLAADLPRHADGAAATGIAERLLRRLAGNLGGRWAGSILRLHALRDGPGDGFAPPAVLAASLASVSPLGAAIARRIAHGHGAEAQALADECCCERAARAASHLPGDEEAYTLVRLNPHLHSNGTQA